MGSLSKTQTGGRIIGEGEDGCVLSEPMWPCAKDSTGKIPDSLNSHYVSKIVSKSDSESEYIKAAARILGPELSAIYLVQLKGECSPASDTRHPSSLDSKAFQNAKAAVLQWPNPNQACGKLKVELQKDKNMGDHKVMVLNKYPMTLNQWGHTVNTTQTQVLNAIPQFISILQKLFQNSSEQLINIDLHAGNIFVSSYTALQFGIADFGHSLLRQHITGSGVLFFGKYLCEYIAIYTLYSDYIQIPIEARLLNYCYMKHLEHKTPGEFIKSWLHDPDVIRHQKQLPDSILANHVDTMTNLLTSPIFIAMIESIQGISRKLSLTPKNPTQITRALSANDKVVLEFIITRYGLISPINVIASVCSMAKINTTTLSTFITAAIEAPYLQTGSSLASALTSVQGADLGILWADIVERS